MFLAIIILLQNSIPCTNIFLYQANFEKSAGTKSEKSSSKFIKAPRFLRSLSTIGSLGPEFSNFKAEFSEEIKTLIKTKQKSMPLKET